MPRNDVFFIFKQPRILLLLPIPYTLHFIGDAVVALGRFEGFAETIGERKHHHATIAFNFKIFGSVRELR